MTLPEADMSTPKSELLLATRECLGGELSWWCATHTHIDSTGGGGGVVPLSIALVYIK